MCLKKCDYEVGESFKLFTHKLVITNIEDIMADCVAGISFYVITLKFPSSCCTDGIGMELKCREYDLDKLIEQYIGD